MRLRVQPCGTPRFVCCRPFVCTSSVLLTLSLFSSSPRAARPLCTSLVCFLPALSHAADEDDVAHSRVDGGRHLPPTVLAHESLLDRGHSRRGPQRRVPCLGRQRSTWRCRRRLECVCRHGQCGGIARLGATECGSWRRVVRRWPRAEPLHQEGRRSGCLQIASILRRCCSYRPTAVRM